MRKQDRMDLASYINEALKDAYTQGQKQESYNPAMQLKIYRKLVPEAGIQEEGVVPTRFQQFNTWQAKYTPRLLKMKEPFTSDQLEYVVGLVGWPELKPILLSMQNYAPLIKNNISANLTCLNWLKRRHENGTGKQTTGNTKQDGLSALANQSSETIYRIGGEYD